MNELRNYALFEGNICISPPLIGQTTPPTVDNSLFSWVDVTDNMPGAYNDLTHKLNGVLVNGVVIWSLSLIEIPEIIVKGEKLQLALAQFLAPDGSPLLKVIQDYFATETARNDTETLSLATMFANQDRDFHSTNQSILSVAESLGIGNDVVRTIFERALEIQNSGV